MEHLKLDVKRKSNLEHVVLAAAYGSSTALRHRPILWVTVILLLSLLFIAL